MPKNVFPYPGNKARHSDWIISHLPEHECYVELFGGAAGVLFNKPKSRMEVYNDLNGDIPHFFQVLRDKGNELQEWLKNVPYSRGVYEEWATQYYNGFRPDDDIRRAGIFFALRYLSFAGKIDTKGGFASAAGNIDTIQSRQFAHKVNRITEFRDRLRAVEIECGDAFEVIDRHDSEDALFYADPPYEGVEGRYNSEGFSHKKLARKAKQVQGKIAISYDSVPPFYGDAFTVVSKSSNFSGGNADGQKECTEYLIMNYDSEGEPIMSDHGQQTLTDISQSG